MLVGAARVRWVLRSLFGMRGVVLHKSLGAEIQPAKTIREKLAQTIA